MSKEHPSTYQWISQENLIGWEESRLIYSVLKGKIYQVKILYPAKLSFQNEGETRTSTDKQKLREFITTRPAFQEMLKLVLYAEMKGCKCENIKH